LTRIFILIFAFCIIAGKNVNAQDDWWKDKRFKDDGQKAKYSLCKKTFKNISEGFNYQYLNIISNERGYYSSNQAELILTDFMEYFKVVSFKYKHSYLKNSFAFAIGKYIYDRGSGKRELNASISLKYIDDVWIIDQISIN
jgi:hypothetical protein